MKVDLRIAILVILALIVPSFAFPSGLTFECGFTQEKVPDGKSNQASCSMDPDKVFTAFEQHPYDKNQHCEVSPVYLYTDLVDFLVTNELVSWTSKVGLTEASKPKQKKYNIKQGESEKEAERSVNSIHTTKYSFQVFSHYVGQDNVYINSLSGKPYKEPRTQKVHIYNFGSDNEHFSLYIPETSKKAILIRFWGEEESSWVTLSFGTCRISSK
jgi:hypothetical protein